MTKDMKILTDMLANGEFSNASGNGGYGEEGYYYNAQHSSGYVKGHCDSDVSYDNYYSVTVRGNINLQLRCTKSDFYHSEDYHGYSNDFYGHANQQPGDAFPSGQTNQNHGGELSVFVTHFPVLISTADYNTISEKKVAYGTINFNGTGFTLIIQDDEMNKLPSGYRFEVNGSAFDYYSLTTSYGPPQYEQE